METRIMRAASTGLALLALGAGGLIAHGEATLKSPTAAVPAGEALVLNGAGFVPDEEHVLLLRGPLSEYELGRATAGADSTFTLEVVVPEDARPGQYRIVALAPDDDEVASLDMPVLAAVSSSAPAEMDPGMHSDGAGAHAMASEARADEIVIERSRAGIEWGIIGLVIGLAGGLGLGLLGRGATA